MGYYDTAYNNIGNMPLKAIGTASAAYMGLQKLKTMNAMQTEQKVNTIRANIDYLQAQNDSTQINQEVKRNIDNYDNTTYLNNLVADERNNKGFEETNIARGDYYANQQRKLHMALGNLAQRKLMVEHYKSKLPELNEDINIRSDVEKTIKYLSDKEERDMINE